LGQTAINLDGVSTMAFLLRSKQVEGAETGNSETYSKIKYLSSIFPGRSGDFNRHSIS